MANVKHMKLLIISMIVFLPLVTWGQGISFHNEINNSNDPSIISVKELWESYVNSSNSGSSKASSKYWNQFETILGFTDIVLAQGTIPFYLIGDLEVYKIEKVESGFYRIRNKWSFRVGESNTLIADFSIYAKNTISGYKLYNHFFLAKSDLQNFKVGNIDFYYPTDYPFNGQRATRMAKLYSEISALYGFTEIHKVTYIIGNDLDEANRFIGFDFTIMSSPFKCAAYTIKDMNIIITSVDNHIHEVIHSIFMPEFPNSNTLFHEGIATYYGGSCGKEFSQLVYQLNDLIENNPNTNLANIDDLNEILEDGTNYFYTVGAIFIDYALTTGGAKMVLALFRHPVTNQYTSDDAIDAINKELGLEKSQIDTFLRKYVKDYTSRNSEIDY
jgi:hypothetical protein